MKVQMQYHQINKHKIKIQRDKEKRKKYVYSIISGTSEQFYHLDMQLSTELSTSQIKEEEN